MADSSTNPSASITSLRVQTVQLAPGFLPLLRGKTGQVALNGILSNHLQMSALEWSRVTIGQPAQVSGTLTKVVVTPGPHSSYRGPVEATYVRYAISALNNLTIPNGGWATVAAFISYVQGLGYGVIPADFDLVKSTRRADGSVSIYPSKTSWLFGPDGSYDSSSMPKIESVLPNLTTSDFDNTPPLHLGILTGTLTGFEVVPPLVLGDLVVNDVLTGFDAKGGN